MTNNEFRRSAAVGKRGAERRMFNEGKSGSKRPPPTSDLDFDDLRNSLEVGEVASVDIAAYTKRAGQIIARSMEEITRSLKRS